ncbi:MAG: hypothetical protein ABSG41_18010 [Bryobacteraceae bacterium]|jgi:hypothetical protein
MRNRRIFSSVTLVTTFAGLALMALPLSAQVAPGQPVPVRTAIPKTADGKPDFTGVWAGPGFKHQVGRGDTDTPSVTNFDPKLWAPFKPGGEAKFLQPLNEDTKHDDPTAFCLPDGHPREVLAPYATQIVQSPGQIIFFYEYMHFFRIIPTDGRPHSADVDLTYEGDAVAKWEGDTLVIDTIGLKSWPLDAFTNKVVRYHSDKLHTIERIKYTDPMTATYEITIDDPEIFTKPWSQMFGMKLHPTWKLLEQVCEDNNRCENGKCTPADVQQKSK